jgi:hypothetical protein
MAGTAPLRTFLANANLPIDPSYMIIPSTQMDIPMRREKKKKKKHPSPFPRQVGCLHMVGYTTNEPSSKEVEKVRQ